MAKVLKVFVNVILILFILTGLALLVPPLAGITTVVAEAEMETNMQTGSVTYGLSTSLGDLNAGDRILWADDSSAYIYEVVAVDTETGTATVQTAAGAPERELELGNTAQRAVFTIPFIGYVSIALQTMEGRIILGLAALLLIVLFIVAEVWSRRSDEDTEEDDEDEEEDEELTRKERKAREKARKQQKKEKKRKEKRGEGEEDLFFQELADKKRSADAEREQRMQMKTDPADEMAEARKPVPEQDAEVFIQHVDGFAGEAEDETERLRREEEALTAELKAADVSGDTAEADDVLEPDSLPDDREMSEEDSEVQELKDALAENDKGKEIGTDTIPNVQAALEAALETQQVSHSVQVPETAYAEAPEETGEMPEEIELAMPVKSVEEMLQEAYTDGDDPVLREDEITGVKFVDFSDCL